MEGILYMEEGLEEVNRKISSILSTDNNKMGEIIKWAYTRKGKQLRPRFVLASSRFGTDYDSIHEVAAITEIIHMASLVQDDIIDNSDYRRGIKSVQYKFGIPMAIYVADYMLFSAFSVFETNVLWERKNLMPLIMRSAKKILSGELSQHTLLYNMDITPDQYLENVSGKTGVLFSMACEAGALAAGAEEDIVRNLSEFAMSYGIVFQIRDDFLDFFSQKKTIGKPTLQDFQRGVYTLPLIYALEQPEVHSFAEKLREKAMRKEKISSSERKTLTGFVESYGIERARAVVEGYYRKACKSLATLPECEEKRYFADMLGQLHDGSEEVWGSA